jgi:hypothetical protein
MKWRRGRVGSTTASSPPSTSRFTGWICPDCHTVNSSGEVSCGACHASIRWHPDRTVELYVTGVADEVESVTQRLAADLTSSRATSRLGADASHEAQSRWERSGKIWAFIIGLATVVGGIAALLALVIHLPRHGNGPSQLSVNSPNGLDGPLMPIGDLSLVSVGLLVRNQRVSGVNLRL